MNLNVGEGDQRRELLHQVGMNLPELTSTSDWITRTFSDSEQLSTNEFHALVVIAMANAGSAAMTPAHFERRSGCPVPRSPTWCNACARAATSDAGPTRGTAARSSSA